MIKIGFFGAKDFEQKMLASLEAYEKYQWIFYPNVLTLDRIKHMVPGVEALCCFVTDDLSAPVLKACADRGVRLILLRSAGFDHVDLKAAKALGLAVYRVPRYSPEAVAEFALGLLLSVLRKIHLGYGRALRHDFSLDGLLGCNLSGKTIGVVGTGNIGACFLKLVQGFSCRLLAYDPLISPDCKAMGVSYVSLETLCVESDVLSLHCPLNESTHHLIGREQLSLMKSSAVLINTARGAVIDTLALRDALKQGRLAGAALDVYEHEKSIFFRDHSATGIEDELLLSLQALPQVLITGHQAYLTEEALRNILSTTLDNVAAFVAGKSDNCL